MVVGWTVGESKGNGRKGSRTTTNKGGATMKVENLLAIYQFCADYHSGQWSRGYRLLCRTHTALKRRKIGGDYLSRPYRRFANRDLYRYLEENYQRKV